MVDIASLAFSGGNVSRCRPDVNDEGGVWCRWPKRLLYSDTPYPISKDILPASALVG